MTATKMYRTFVVLIILLINNNRVQCDYALNNADYGNSKCSVNHYECESLENKTISTECEANTETLLDTLKTIHSDGINTPLVINVNAINETVDRFARVRHLVRKLNLSYKEIIIKAVKVLSEANLSRQCVKSFETLLTEYRNDNFWPLKFIDSSGKIPNGLLSIVFTSFGDFDQCLNIESRPLDRKGSAITGKYCMLELKIPSDFFDPNGKIFSAAKPFIEQYGLFYIFKIAQTSFRYAICVPSQCEQTEIQNAINEVFRTITRGLSVEIVQKCSVKNQTHSLDNYEVFAICGICLLIIFAVISTGFEVILTHFKKMRHFYSDDSNKTTSKHNQLLQSFSLIKNTKSLFEENSRFTSLDTIRLLLIFWVVIIHVYVYSLQYGLITAKNFFGTVPTQFLSSLKYGLLRNPQLVDALIVLSGFTFSYQMLDKLQKNGGKISYPSFVIQKWLRFLLPQIGAYLFFILLPLLGSGPVWEVGLAPHMSACKSPTTLLYGSFHMLNFLTLDHYCNSPVWFVSAIFQLQIIAPAYIVLYYKKPSIASIALLVTVIIGLVLNVSPYFFGIIPYTQLMKLKSAQEFLDASLYYHSSTSTHVVNFFVGIIFGIGLRKGVRFSKTVAALLWLLSVITFICVMLWSNSLWQQTVDDYNAVLFFSFGRFFSALVFGWIYLACCSGSAVYLSQLLNWSAFRLLNKLSFSIYVTHMIIVLSNIFSAKQSVSMTDAFMIHTVIIDVILATCLACVFYLLVDYPVYNILTIMTTPNTTTNSAKLRIKLKDYVNNINNNNNNSNNNNNLNVIRL